MDDKKPCSDNTHIPSRLPRGLIQPLRILVFAGFAVSVLYVISSDSIGLTGFLSITLQIVFSLIILSECGNSEAAYKAADKTDKLKNI